ncbi:hypothetical protein NSS79_12565 [Paenibacillus sp. FSL L8-0436]|uniref:hypothetical protein n=1 Tax=Paenibacillus sp. FSL L8-0436 TaxID=2954686 RepID=UPI0031586EC3
MTRKRLVTVLTLLIVLLSACDTSSDTEVEKNEEYNLMITNNSPLDLKSVVVTVKQKDTTLINSLIDSNIKPGEVAKFRVEDGKQTFKITLNPKENYSVSKEFNEVFGKGEIVEYQVIIEENEVTIKKIKANE